MKKGIYLFLALLIVACSSDDGANNSNSLEVSWQVTVEGQTYENSSLSGSGFFSSKHTTHISYITHIPRTNVLVKRRTIKHTIHISNITHIPSTNV